MPPWLRATVVWLRPDVTRPDLAYLPFEHVNTDWISYCLTEKCSQRVKRCLTKHAPVASLSCGRAAAPLPFHKSMLTDVGPVELWATR